MILKYKINYRQSIKKYALPDPNSLILKILIRGERDNERMEEFLYFNSKDRKGGDHFLLLI